MIGVLVIYSGLVNRKRFPIVGGPESLAIQGFVHPVSVVRATRRERALRKRRSPHHTLVEKVANDSGLEARKGLIESRRLMAFEMLLMEAVFHALEGDKPYEKEIRIYAG
jgi:hypothetical protein